MKDFLWVRSAFRSLMTGSQPHVAKMESMLLAIAWSKAEPSTQSDIVAELTLDIKNLEAGNAK